MDYLNSLIPTGGNSSSSSSASGNLCRYNISKLGRKVMVVMVVMGSNVLMKNSSNGSNGSNHKVMDLKMDHIIMKQSLVVIR